MIEKEEKAKKLFDSGLNCAQSVLSVFAGDLRFDADLALRISSAFGGGMGRLQEKCGAVTGAFMVFGIYCNDKYCDDKERKEKTNTLVKEFDRKFTELHGSSNCMELLNVDLNTEEGRAYLEQNKLRENICSKCVYNSVKLINEMIGNKETK